MRHVTDADMEQLLSGRLEPGEEQGLLRHLLSRCRFCRKHLELISEILSDEGDEGIDAPSEDPGHDLAIDRAFAVAEASVPHWREEASRVASNLAEAPQHPRGVFDLPKETPDEFSWSWVETLLQVIPAERYRDPQHMLMLALSAEAQATSQATPAGWPLPAYSCRGPALPRLERARQCLPDQRESGGSQPAPRPSRCGPEPRRGRSSRSRPDLRSWLLPATRSTPPGFGD